MTIDTLKKTIAKLNYKWFEDQPNIIGIRTTLSIPDVFNDILCIVYKDQGVEKLYTATITTEPGLYYQQKLLNIKGCAVLIPGQYVNCYKVGMYKDQKALVQVGKVKVARDSDKDGIAEVEGLPEDIGYFGLNIHGASKLSLTKRIGPWSAGCQVHSDYKKKDEMVDICTKYQAVNKGLLTYTLITENQLCL